jgi:ABC-type branched-subunit amino acid transport system permease subunit
MAFVIIFASLGLLVRTSGQVSLCQMTFAAVGSSTFAIAANHGVPWALALVVGGLAAVPIGALVALPAIRLRGVYLAVITLGFGILVERVFYATVLMFGATGSLSVPRPKLGFVSFSGNRADYFLTLIIALMVCGLVIVIRRGRLGRMLQALSQTPALLQANGANANVTKLVVFCLSAFLAGIGGGMLGAVTQTTGGLTFDFSVSLLMIAVLFVAGRQPILSAFIAAGLYSVAVAYIKNPTLQNYSGVVFGLTALVVATRFVPIIIDRMKRGRRASERLPDELVTRPLAVSAEVNAA